MSLIGIVSLLVIAALVVGTFVTRNKKQDVGDYQNMNKSAGWLQIAGTYTAALVSAVGMVGLPGQSYSDGYLIGLVAWGSAFATVFMGLFYGPRIRKFSAVTFGEFFENRFNSKRIKLVVSVVVTIGVYSFFLSQIIGSAVVLEQLLDIPYNYTVILSIVVIVVMSAVGGARSVTLTNTIMFAIIGIGLGIIFSPAIIWTVGLDNIHALSIARPEYFGIHGIKNTPLGTVLGTMILWFLGTIGNPVNTTRPFIAKNNREWCKGLMLAYAVTCILIWGMHTAASSIYAINPDIAVANTVLPWAALNIVPPVIGIIATLGLATACISTADTQILTIAQSVVTDIYAHVRKDISGEGIIKATKIAITILGVISLPFVFGKPDFILIFGTFGSTVFGSTFFPVLTFAMFCKWITREGAYASIITGIVSDVILHVIPVFMGQAFGYTGYLPFSIHPVVWSTLISTAVLLLVSKLTKPDAQQIACFETAMSTQEDRSNYCSDASMIRWAWGLMGFGVIFFAIILAFATII